MQTIRIKSTAQFGTQYFPIQLGIIQSTDFINMVKDAGPSTFQRSYTSLHELSPDNIFKTNFNGYDVWGAFKKVPLYYLYCPSKGAAGLTAYKDYANRLGLNYSQLNFDENASYVYPTGTYQGYCLATNVLNVDGIIYPYEGGSISDYSAGLVKYTSGMIVSHLSFANFIESYVREYSNNQITFRLVVLPDNYFFAGNVNPIYIDDPSNKAIVIMGAFKVKTDGSEITQLVFDSVSTESLSFYNTYFEGIHTPGYAVETEDIDNPYGENGTSTIGGGDGSLPSGPEGLDYVDPTDIPDLPTASAASTGFITLYNPSNANLSSLGSFLWSNMFDLNTFKKMFVDPMDCIVSLGIVPCVPNSGGTRNIFFGNIDTGVNCTFLSSQFAKVNCGSVDIKKYVGSFMDYSPYVKVSLFLPYIGFIHLGTDDIMGGSINVTYNVDVLSGDCIAFITHSEKGVLYSYTGNCLTNVPVTGANYSGALRHYYESVTGIIPSTVNGAMSGGAAGAGAAAGASALDAASNIILNSKPAFQRSGSLGGSAGIMGVQRPFIIIERPNISVPNKVQNYVGQTSNITANLGGLSGYTIVEYCHIEGVPCTTEELAEIESLLQQGVIL